MKGPSTRSLALAMTVLVVTLTSRPHPATSSAVAEAARTRADVTLHQLQRQKDDVDRYSLTESLLINMLTNQSRMLQKLTDIAADTKNMTRTNTRYFKTIAHLESKLMNERSKIQNLSDQVLYLQDQVEGMQCNLSSQQPHTTQKTSNTTTAVPQVIRVPECKENYEAIGGECLQFRLSEAEAWQNARRECQLDGGDLAVRFDPELINLRLRGEPVYAILVGSTSLYANGNWWWLRTGAAVEPSFFAPGKPGSNTCGALSRQYNYRMVDVTCRSRLPYICQILPADFWKNG